MRLAPAVLPLVVFLVGCGSAPTSGSDTRGGKTPHVRDRGLYDLGESFEGLPLTHAESGGERTGLFIYGSCEPPGDDGGCAPPLELQEVALASRYPGKFRLAPGRPSWCRRTAVRGVPAAIFQTTGGALELYAGTTVVVIWGSPGQTRRAAEALRPSGAGEAAARRDLPRPPAGVSVALRRCAADSVDANVRDLRRTHAPILWLGRRFAGHPLARVEGVATRARFVYGRCAVETEYDSDGRCWPPLELVVEPLAAAGPSSYAPSVRCRWRRVQGVPVALLPGASTVQVFTRATTVTMFVRDLALALRAAEVLRPLADEVGSTESLAPAPGDLVASLASRCGPASP